MLSERSLNRRLKRQLLKAPQSFFAVCALGFEDELMTEVGRLASVADVQPHPGGVSFNGPLNLLYDANLKLNTAHRLLVRINRFPAHTFSMLFDQASRIAWELWIPDGASYRIQVSTRSSKLNMKQRLVNTVRAGIDDRLKSLGVSSGYDSEATFEIILRLSNNIATVSFNTSGPHLHKRGYKRFSVAAPIRETLAAGILMRVRHTNYDLVVDPFCGSGTFVLEAARMRLGMGAGSFRDFAFMQSPFFSRQKFDSAHTAITNINQHSINCAYVGFDISGQAIDAAQANAKLAKLEHIAAFERSDYRTVDYSALSASYERRLLISNPPYGKRVKTKRSFAGSILDPILSQLSGWTLAIVAPRSPAGSSSSERYTESFASYEISNFNNGGIPSRLHVFRLR